MSVPFNKFDHFIEDFGNKVHDLVGTAGSGADTLKIYLSNITPNATTHAIKTDLAEITNQNGYTAPVSTQNVGTRAAGVLSVVGTDIDITASGGTVGPFRYAVLYNDTPSSPLDPLVGWWDYGSSITLQAGEIITIDFGAEMFNHQ